METTNYIGDELEVFKVAKNWKNYWSSKIRPRLGERVLEVGAGIGTNTVLLVQNQTHWVALEPDSAQCEAISLLVDNRNVEVIEGTLLNTPPEPLYDSVIYIDVLEHIDDDRSELENAMERLKPGGNLVVLSPAHQRLYSPFDKAVGHFRRYSKQSLLALKPRVAELEQLYYLDSVGCIASWLNAALMKSSMPTHSQVWFWDRVMVPLSRVLDPILGYRVGKTVVMVISKS